MPILNPLLRKDEMVNRKKSCPQCGSVLLYRSGDFIHCLDRNCEWKVLSKRSDDNKLPTAEQLRNDLNG